MMEAYWRSAVHPDRVEGISAFNDGREPTFQDSDYWCAQPRVMHFRRRGG